MSTLGTNSSSISMKGNPKVSITTGLQIDETILYINHVADFSNIPTNLHQIFLQKFVSKMTKFDTNKIEDMPLTIKEQQSAWRRNKIIDYYLSGKFLNK